MSDVYVIVEVRCISRPVKNGGEIWEFGLLMGAFFSALSFLSQFCLGKKPSLSNELPDCFFSFLCFPF